jgi:hypothetical protein
VALESALLLSLSSAIALAIAVEDNDCSWWKFMWDGMVGIEGAQREGCQAHVLSHRAISACTMAFGSFFVPQYHDEDILGLQMKSVIDSLS